MNIDLEPSGYSIPAHRNQSPGLEDNVWALNTHIQRGPGMPQLTGTDAAGRKPVWVSQVHGHRGSISVQGWNCVGHGKGKHWKVIHPACLCLIL